MLLCSMCCGSLGNTTKWARILIFDFGAPGVQLTNDTIRDAILTCVRKSTWVSLIYRTEPTTKKCKNRKKTKSRKQVCSEITVNSVGNPRSEYLSRRKEGLQWEGFAEKGGFKPGMREWVGDGIPNNSKYDCWQIKTVKDSTVKCSAQMPSTPI